MRHNKRRNNRALSKSGQAKAGAVRKSAESGHQEKAEPLTYPVSTKTVLLIAAALIAISLYIYAPVLQYGFLSYDDSPYVTDNAQVRRGLTGPGVLWAFTTGHASNWHPVTWLSHMLDVQIFGMNAGGHHFTNLLLHIANSLLLFGLLYRITGAWCRSALVAMLFAAHPLHVESVAWVAERKDVLSTLFWMLTVYAYIGYVKRPRPGRYLAVIAVFALGLMSKPMLVTLPLVLLLLDVWPLNRVRFEAGQKQIWIRICREKIPLFLLVAASSIATILAQSRGGAVQSFEAASLYQRTSNALVSYVAYLGQMLWPRNLAAFYPYKTVSIWLVAASALGLIAVSILVVRLSRSRPFLFAGWFWYVITLVPVIGLIQVGGQARADRYTYIPLIGVFIIAVWGIPLIFERWRRHGIALQAAACILVCALAVGARSQVRYWESELALWENTVLATGDNYFARTNLGFALIDGGDLRAGIEQYNEALRINPNSPETHNALGTALFEQGKLNAAMEHYAMALRIRPGFADAHSNRGIALARQGNTQEAYREFQKSLESSPENPKISYNFGFFLVNQGRLDEAIPYFRKAVELKPDYAEAFFQMGNIFAGKEMLSEAEAEYNRAIQIRPEYEDAHNNLGIILERQNRINEAIIHFREALRINPNSIRAKENMNRVLAK
jgi:Tfp pilus assembly protein PilF